MADVFEKVKKFASDSTKAKGNINFVQDFLFSLKSITKAHLFNLYNCGEKKKKVK